MRQLLFMILTLSAFDTFSQELEITTVDKTRVLVKLLDSTSKSILLSKYGGKQDNTLRKKWTARTFLLSDGKVIVEFYDKSAVLIDNTERFKQLEEVRFVKNMVGFLKKNVSYKIELTFEKGKKIIEIEEPRRLPQYKSEMPEWFDFEVYELTTGQILFLDKSRNFKTAAIYPDIKTLASENSSVSETTYGSQDEEHLMKKLASGDRLSDYDVYDHLIYPKYLKDLVKNHKLTVVERKVYVSEFFGNLYRSEYGYYILVDEAHQENAVGKNMSILSLRIYDSIQQVREAQAEYQAFMSSGVISEHFYQKISDKYGEKFAEVVPDLVNTLPTILNFDREQLSFDSVGIDLVDESLKWNWTDKNLFDSWFPSVLAFYGQCYILGKNDGKWDLSFDKENRVWIPVVRLSDGSFAWDWIDFYKDLYEWPIPLRWTGDWDGTRKRVRSGNGAQDYK